MKLVIVLLCLVLMFSFVSAYYCPPCRSGTSSTGACTSVDGYDYIHTTSDACSCGCCTGTPEHQYADCNLGSCWGCPPLGSSCDNGPTCTSNCWDTSSTAYYCPGTSCSVSCASPSGCASSCTVMGNGIIETGEECDDGNTANGDGCSSTGIIESGYTCSGEPSVCNVIYGDGTIIGSEECDDGNLVDGDGCSSTGIIEEGWSCSGEPSVCIPDCQFTSSSWSETETTSGTLVELNVEGTDCDGKAVMFEVFENELIGRDAVLSNPANVNFSGSSATGSWIAEWIDDGFAQGNLEYVFKASLVSASYVEIDDSGELKVLPGDGSIDCSNVTSCSNYLTFGGCVSDSCDVVEGSVESNNPLVDCSAGDVRCECSWVSDSCEPAYTSIAGGYIVGTCSYKESTSDDCEDSFLSYSWTKTWTWGHEGWVDWNDGPSVSVEDYELDSGKYYYDPDEKFDDCVDGNTLVECPASIQLGFFNSWNLIVAVIVLIGVYYFRNKKFIK